MNEILIPVVGLLGVIVALNLEFVRFVNVLSEGLDAEGKLIDGTKAMDYLDEELADLVEELNSILIDEIEASRRPWYESLWNIATSYRTDRRRSKEDT